MPVTQNISTTGVTGNNKFEDYTTTTSYVERTFGFPAQFVTLTNDSDTDDAQFSWDGTTQIGEVKCAESVKVAGANNTSIYIKATTGGDKVRIMAE